MCILVVKGESQTRATVLGGEVGSLVILSSSVNRVAPLPCPTIGKHY